MKVRIQWLVISSIIILAFVAAAIISAIVCSYSLKASEYDVDIKNLSSDIKIVCISDLHSKEYGEGNSKLITLIAEQIPRPYSQTAI